ncbi:hypothetical protein [Telluria beijingensis]|uniref:hypothetical protein n=1 Tax=Telluria beijingensis TaxID=3068633 RepID=UPI0027963119|nr:hypothetical protein [Massilia sp. REN29]
MLAQSNPPAVHAGEDQSSSGAVPAIRQWSTEPPEPEARSLSELASAQQWLRPGDVVYTVDVRRHVLTESDLNAAARAVIGGVQ